MKTLYAVLGRDVAKSLSPTMQEAAAWELGLPMAYLACSVGDREHFVQAIHALRILGARGANVTTPYKEAGYAVVDRHTPEASAMGCVNTVRFDPGAIIGHNTDGPALRTLIEELPPERRSRVQILGAGGAARAAVWAAQPLADEVVVCARRHAESLAARFGARGAALGPVPGATLVISALPSDAIPPDRLLHEWVDPEARPRVLDLAYLSEGVPTLVRAAREWGLEAEDGRRMLAEQGARSLAFWTGANVDHARAVMLRAVGRNARFDSTSGQV